MIIHVEYDKSFSGISSHFCNKETLKCPSTQTTEEETAFLDVLVHTKIEKETSKLSQTPEVQLFRASVFRRRQFIIFRFPDSSSFLFFSLPSSSPFSLPRNSFFIILISLTELEVTWLQSGHTADDITYDRPVIQ